MSLVPVALLERAGPENQDTGGSSHLSHCVIWFSNWAFAFPHTHYPMGQFNDNLYANELLRRQSSPRAASGPPGITEQRAEHCCHYLCHQYRAQVTVTHHCGLEQQGQQQGTWGQPQNSMSQRSGSEAGAEGSQNLSAAGQEKVKTPPAPGQQSHPSASKRGQQMEVR